MAISSNFDNLPKEIMSEIMLRLPAESLMQFKSVNKSFHSFVSSLVEDPKFVAKHLRFSEADLSTPTYFLTYGLCPRRNSRVQELEFYLKSGVLLLTILSDRGNKDEKIHCAIEDLSLPLDTVLARKGNPLILSTVFCLEAYHCNGIICLAKDGEKIVLYNPTLHKYKTFVLESLSDPWEILGTGFGWDSRANEYKFVRISCDSNTLIAAVFDFGTNHSWRGISIPEYVHSRLYSCVYCKGTCYWLMCSTDLIISFDMGNEEFHTIHLPDDCQQYEGGALGLTLKDDSVCLFRYPSRPVGRGQMLESIQMWVMDISSNGGVQACNYSWKKFLTIEHLEEIYYPSTFWKSDELLMKTRFGRAVSYNIGTRKLRDLHLPLHGMEVKSIRNPVPFMKSLVPLKAQRNEKGNK
ncbi:F-box/kelch-repeat protein [Morus notabilis]|uniref:F-box/kelch-repeat protein n=1 Tax=Morus notabilis TaxID=981085 RepID=W9QIP9_9ROSA|nr:F-box/kelch-repeat protein [Morus notabilis]